MKLGRMSEKWEEAGLNGATRTLFLLDDGGKEKKKKNGRGGIWIFLKLARKSGRNHFSINYED